MRRGDRKILEGYNEVAKDALSGDEEGTDLERLEQVLDWKLEKAAEKQGTSKEMQIEVFQIQAKKQEIMQELKEQIRCLDDPERQEAIKKDDRIVHRNKKGFYVERSSGRQYISLGEMLTDGEWGISYHLDSETVSRDVRKRYLVTEARRVIRGFADIQLLSLGTERGDFTKSKQDFYSRMLKEEQSGKRASEFGLIAEAEVINLLEKFAIDYELPYQIQAVDVEEDFEHKIDFVIRRTDHTRAVGIKDTDAERLAVQFTTFQGGREGKHARGHLKKKHEQLARVRELLGGEVDNIDDYLLVAVPRRWTRASIRKWREQHKPSGGPDKYLSSYARYAIFFESLLGMFTEEEISEMWEKVGGSKPKDVQKAA